MGAVVGQLFSPDQRRVVLIISATLIVVGLALVVFANAMKRRALRGFEVKPTTGSSPVLRQKENDHG